MVSAVPGLEDPTSTVYNVLAYAIQLHDCGERQRTWGNRR